MIATLTQVLAAEDRPRQTCLHLVKVTTGVTFLMWKSCSGFKRSKRSSQLKNPRTQMQPRTRSRVATTSSSKKSSLFLSKHSISLTMPRWKETITWLLRKFTPVTKLNRNWLRTAEDRVRPPGQETRSPETGWFQKKVKPTSTLRVRKKQNNRCLTPATYVTRENGAPLW